MTKTRIARDELRAKVLAAIRQEPGCEGVKEVAISEQVVLGEGTSWRVSIIDHGVSQRDAAFHAAKRVEESLNPRYELTSR